MACPHCHANAGASDLFCYSCGARLAVCGPAASAAGAGIGIGGVAAGAGFASVTGRPSLAESLHAQRRPVRLVLIVVLNLVLFGASAWLVNQLLLRYRKAAPPVAPGVSLGQPRFVRTAPSLDAAQGVAPTPAPAVASGGQRPTPPRPIKTGRPSHGTATGAGSGGVAKVGSGAGAASRAVDPTATHTANADAGAASGSAGSGAGAADAAALGSGTAGSGAAGSGPASGTSSGGADTAEQTRARLDADSVRMVVQHHLPQVRACYDRALKQQEKIAGSVEIQFEVATADGKVRSSQVHSNTTGHQGLGRCIAAALKSWRFPRPVGGDTTFIYPFAFSSGE